MTLLQEKPDQTEKEIEVTKTKINQEKTLTPSIVKEDLTVLKGVGPRIKEILHNAGIISIVKLAQMTDTNLIQVGVGQARAKKIIARAKEHIHKRNLDLYAQNNEIIKESGSESEPVIINDDPFYNTENEEVEDNNSSYPSSEIEVHEYGEYIEKENHKEIKIEPWFEEKFKYSRLTESRDPPRDFPFETKENIRIPQEVDEISETMEDRPLNYYKIMDDKSQINFKQGEDDFKHYLKTEPENAGMVIISYSAGLEALLDKKVTPYLRKLIPKYRNKYHNKETSQKFNKAFENLFKKNKVITAGQWVRIIEDYQKKTRDKDKLEFFHCLQDNFEDSNLRVIQRACEIVSHSRKAHGGIYTIKQLIPVREKCISVLNPVIDIFYEDSQECGTNEIVQIEEEYFGQEFHDLKIPLQNNNSYHERLFKKVKSADFFIIEKTKKLRQLFVGIDAVAIKLIRVKEFLDVICIVPFIMSNLKGYFTVSEGIIDYIPINENENLFETKKQAQLYIKSLKRAEKTIFNDLANNGELLHYISKFFDINISSEKTITHKMLYLHSGPLQYEVLIEPIILCQNTVGFTEKLIPFAYIREMNIHIVSLSQLSELLSYLDQKYFFIETYSEKQNAVILNNKAETIFMKEIRLVSVPFTIYGFTFLLIFLFQGFSLLSLLINISYGVVSLYIIVVGYIYLKLTHEKKEIKQQFAVPYYRRNLGLNDDKLNLIKQQFTPKLMEQFGYEILGKGSDSALMEKVEQENAKNYLADKIMKRQLEKSKLFEEQTTPYSDSPRPNISPEAIDKYSSFLED